MTKPITADQIESTRVKTNAQWQNRIVGHGEEPPDQLLANPRNWRIHPRTQREALRAVLGRVGWLRPVIVNTTTNQVVDGHLRVALALDEGLPTVPVAYVTLSEDEERAVLATHDPLAELAVVDKDAYQALLTGADANELLELLGAAQPLNDDPYDGLENMGAPLPESTARHDEVVCPGCGTEWIWDGKEGLSRAS